MLCVLGLNCCLEEIKIEKVVRICDNRTHDLKRELLILGKNISNEKILQTVLRKVSLWVINLYVEVIVFQ